MDLLIELLLILGPDIDIIEQASRPLLYRLEDLYHQCLEDYRGVIEAEQHYKPLEQTEQYSEYRLLNAILVYLDYLKAVLKVKKHVLAIACGSLYFIEYVQEWEDMFLYYRINLMEVVIDLEDWFTAVYCFLRDQHDS